VEANLSMVEKWQLLLLGGQRTKRKIV